MLELIDYAVGQRSLWSRRLLDHSCLLSPNGKFRSFSGIDVHALSDFCNAGITWCADNSIDRPEFFRNAQASAAPGLLIQRADSHTRS